MKEVGEERSTELTSKIDTSWATEWDAMSNHEEKDELELPHPCCTSNCFVNWICRFLFFSWFIGLTALNTASKDDPCVGTVFKP